MAQLPGWKARVHLRGAIQNGPGTARLHTFSQDVRFSVRLLRKNPGFAAAAILLTSNCNSPANRWILATVIRRTPRS
jgi:hypothetical protein